MSKESIVVPKAQWLLQTSIAILLATLVSSCSSGGSSGEQPNEDPEPPSGNPAPEIPEQPSGNPVPEIPEQPSVNPVPEVPEQPQVVSVGTLVTDTLGVDESRVYRVPADTEIILTTQTGDADIFLHEAEELTEDTLLCSSTFSSIEDICTASSTSGQLYATVTAFEPSSYTISATNDCSTESINRWVYRSMQDYYLFADQVPTINPDLYNDPSDLMADLVDDTIDPYSSVQNAQSRQAFLDEGKSFGFGAGFSRDNEGNLRIAFVYSDSVFGLSGVKRGDIIVSIGGVPTDSITSEIFDDLVGTDSDPLPVEWEFIDGDTGELKTIEAVKGEHAVNTVLHTASLVNEDFNGRVGYLVFKNFLRISEDELNTAISRLAEDGVTELVLDLRYNGGGYTYIARRLAAQIAGASLNGQLAVSYEFNSKYTDQNFSRNFETAEPTLNLTRLVVLTDDGTASSSELLINSLRPYFEVITIGERTEGKAFISAGREFCGKVINAMEAQGVNASGVSVAGGIPADCYAADDLSRNFGLQSNAVEGMLQSALDYVANGTCNVVPTIAASRNRDRALPFGEIPIVGAIDD